MTIFTLFQVDCVLKLPLKVKKCQTIWFNFETYSRQKSSNAMLLVSQCNRSTQYFTYLMTYFGIKVMLVVSQNVMGAQDPTNLFQLHESFIRPHGTNRQINKKRKYAIYLRLHASN